MTGVNSTPSASTHKPPKPPGSPLYSHRTRRWAKRVRGKIHYFGPWSWDLPDHGHGEALKLWREQEAELRAGLVPRSRRQEGVTLRELGNAFLNTKKELMDQGSLSSHCMRDYVATCKRLIDFFGLYRLLTDI